MPARLLRRSHVTVAVSVSLGWAAVTLPSPARAQPQPVGSPFQVNTYTTGDQDGAGVASTPTGDFVVVWRAEGTGGFRLRGQRFDASGTSLGGEFPVSSGVPGAGTVGSPRVSSAADGSFVVVWQQGGDVFGRRFEAAGNPVGSEFLVPPSSAGTQTNPSVASGAGGEFVVAWQAGGFQYPDIFAQRFDASGNRAGAEFLVNSFTPQADFAPAVAMAEGGDFVVVWSFDYYFPFEFRGDVRGRRFDAAGNALGGDFVVSEMRRRQMFGNSITTDSGGGFVVAWGGGYVPCIAEPGRAPASGCSDAAARRYDSQGNPVTGEIVVEPTGNYSFLGDVVALDEDFVVVWSTDGQPLGQHFAGSGHRVGSTFPLESTGALARLGAHDFVVVWTDDGPSETDIFGQLYTLPELLFIVDGVCPGPVTATILNAPPNSEIAIITAANNNGFVKGGALCNGTQLEVGEPFNLPPTFLIVDENGNGSTEVELAFNRCWIEALSLASCQTTGARRIR
jgi:hypothetical protein